MDIEKDKYEATKQQIVGVPGSDSGTAPSMLERGADQIYLFNHMHSLATPIEEIRPIYTEAGRIDTACRIVQYAGAEAIRRWAEIIRRSPRIRQPTAGSFM